MPEPIRILLVEDSATQAVRLGYLLEQQGWEVVCTGTAEQALDELNRRLPDLIVADYHLPGLYGDELCQRVRMNLDTRGIPILMLTADATEQAQLHGLESGADDYVSKSVDDDILVLRIKALLRKTRVQCAILGPGEQYFRKARILIIDDSRTYLTFLAEELAEEGFTVETVTEGRSGLQRVAQDAFDCVIVDLIMPEMDGIQVCQRLIELRQAMDSPIVVLMLTAQENKEDMTRGLEAGADDFVGKSNDIAVLKARIRALLRRKFFQEENQRIIQELKDKELEAVRARAAKEVAEARASLVEQLEQTNRELEETNRKLRDAQTQLVHSEKMASLGQLVAGIAHEINNPLSFVVSNVFTIRTGIDKVIGPLEAQLPEDSRRRLEKIRARLADSEMGLERVKTLVQKLRTFSRLDAGGFGTLDVRESIEMVLKILCDRWQERIVVTTDYAGPARLECYAGEFNQVLMNVLSNAIDAIEGQGRIQIDTRQENGCFVLRVRDSGCGIPPQTLGRIFDPFFTTKPVGKGTGLGLSIAYGIVQGHQGEITVDSTPGQGSEFRIAIPLDLPDRLRGTQSNRTERTNP